jgi:trehalose/maltose transport system substrate-binding protein
MAPLSCPRIEYIRSKPSSLGLLARAAAGIRESEELRWQTAFGGGLLALAWAVAGAAHAVTLSLACSAVGREFELCREGAQTWAQRTGNEVRLVSVPNSANERLALFQQLLAARAPDIDVFQIDVVWPGILAGHLVDLAPYAGEAPRQHFAAIVANNTVRGRLVAMPWYADVGVLYYRTDLLQRYGEPVPQTWAALSAAAERIQNAERAAGSPRMWGFVWQGRAYEGLTCNALEWIASHDGGTIVDAQGEVTVDNPRAVEAVRQASGWVDRITPRGVLNYTEEEARGVFQSGSAVFMRNWPYAYALGNAPDSPVRGRIGVAPLPKGGPVGRHAGTLGGWQLAVSRYSEHRSQAIDLVLYLTSAAEQKRRAIAAAYNPTIPALYHDPEVLAAQPFLAGLEPMIAQAVPRPARSVGTRYNQVSAKFWSAVHAALSGRQTAQESMGRLDRELERLRRVGRW